MRLDNANRDVERRFKDGVTGSEGGEACEKNTVKKLEEAVVSAEKNASDRLYLFRRQKLFISSLSSGTEKLDASAVAEVRDEVGKILSWSVEDAKKGGADGGKR